MHGATVKKISLHK